MQAPHGWAEPFPRLEKVTPIVGPQTAEVLQPIDITTGHDDIKIEVVATLNDEELVVVYLAVQDLTGNRVDPNIQLYHYMISGANGFTNEW